MYKYKIVHLNRSKRVKDMNKYCHNNYAMQSNMLFKKVEITAKRYLMDLPGKAGENNIAYLTHREATIVSLMIDGKRPKEIAWELKNSPHTINSHISNIKGKLKCTNNFQLGYALGRFRLDNQQQI